MKVLHSVYRSVGSMFQLENN